ncbi:sensor domain-containing diguanylate cyclase [Brevibacillus choshinensis]|uniref:GGDEF domain-containing protein n=1 Tax=Brevibacillus choshinensis TaxID=54911 RepID=A0ABX7FM13_BRECH|nr:sensor domain-containing diguanylate cyclase [Brevibacillus choshinensis]QRG66773.1 GGDEF domain-containing protein [Brevibacillus choshinensis]
MSKRKTYTLRFILELLVVFSVIITFLIGVISSIRVNTSSLAANYLENNFHYAKKLSSNTTEVLSSMQNTLNALAVRSARQTVTHTDLQDWFAANKQFFHSIFIADTTGTILQMAPSIKGIESGTHLTSPAAKEALFLKKPVISKPYIGVTGRLIVLISAPIVNPQGEYKGFVAGSIFLEEPNVLSRMLSQHFYGDGSYMYVVDRDGRLIFHPDKARLGESVAMNPAIQKALAGESGYAEIVNSRGTSFFAGYTYEHITGWGIVSQTPTSRLDVSNQQLLQNLLATALPFLLINIIIVWLFAKHISTSLSNLALFSGDSVKSASPDGIPTTTSKIYEVQKLYQSTRLAMRQVNKRMLKLQTEVRIDELTRLFNRRMFNSTLSDRIKNKTPFSLIMLDIDHFKKINDTYGHVMGDEVLKLVAQTMLEQTREEDLCFRYGGEEFAVLIHDESQQLAYHIAERIRLSVAALEIPTHTKITLSLGIANFPLHGCNPIQLVACADLALYHSKEQGRNQTTLHPSDKSEGMQG